MKHVQEKQDSAPPCPALTPPACSASWVRVQDGLPVESQRVIAIYRGVYHHRIVTFWRDGGGNPHFGHPRENDGKGSQPATHWHPLPEMPKPKVSHGGPAND